MGRWDAGKLEHPVAALAEIHELGHGSHDLDFEISGEINRKQKTGVVDGKRERTWMEIRTSRRENRTIKRM